MMLQCKFMALHNVAQRFVRITEWLEIEVAGRLRADDELSYRRHRFRHRQPCKAPVRETRRREEDGFEPSVPLLRRFALGHAHHGFTLGPVSGRLLAEMMTEEEPFTEPSSYAAGGFVNGVSH
jgi:glycine/D-amino acid oxidase-like deaminating enzyme